MTGALARRCVRRLPWFLAAVIAMSPSPGEAQLQRGAIRGVARDASGGVLPGAVVTLTSELGAPQETISGVLGEFRFVNLDPGRYDLQATLDGFAPYVRESIIVGVGATVELPLQLDVATRIETVRVTAATPMLESRRQGNVTNFDQVMLNEIPTARDPWALMQHLPGVTIDRPNVGGSRSATQAAIAARGDDGSNTSWNIDGVTITDPAAAGGSSTYFDFNAFEEVQFTTGGIDPRQQTGALGINIVTKRGTNAWQGLARVYFTNDALQQENLPASLQRRGLTGNRVNQLAEYGGDAGGPLKRDRVWIWGAAARNDIRQLAFTGYPDDSILNSVSAKADVQLAHGQPRVVLSSPHREAGDRPLRRGDQAAGNHPESGRPGLDLQSRGRPRVRIVVVPVGQGRLRGRSVRSHAAGRAQRTGVPGSGDADLARQPDDHEERARGVPDARGRNGLARPPGVHVRIGVPRRQCTRTCRRGPATRRWPSSTFRDCRPHQVWRGSRGPAPSPVNPTRSGSMPATPLTVRDWTFNLGLRFDRQQAQNRPSRTVANGLLPERLPALEYGGGPRLTWNVWSPRIAAAYRIGDRTIARGSYAKFGSQLQWLPTVGVENPARLAFIEYLFVDANGDHLAQALGARGAHRFCVERRSRQPGSAGVAEPVRSGVGTAGRSIRWSAVSNTNCGRTFRSV